MSNQASMLAPSWALLPAIACLALLTAVKDMINTDPPAPRRRRRTWHRCKLTPSCPQEEEEDMVDYPRVKPVSLTQACDHPNPNPDPNPNS